MTPKPEQCNAKKPIANTSTAADGEPITHALDAVCAQPHGHAGAHEADDPFDPEHRVIWGDAGSAPVRNPAAADPQATPPPRTMPADSDLKEEELAVLVAVAEEFGHLNRIIASRELEVERLTRELEFLSKARA